jgi:PAS domain S-box-containing protein
LEQKSFLTLQYTYELIINTDELLSSLTDAETGTLGYLLTREPRWLRPYHTSRRALYAQVEQLRRLVQKDPNQREQVEKLSPLIQQKLESLSELIRERDSERFDATRSMALTEHGKQLTDHIRQIITEMKDDQQSELARFSQTRQSRLETGLAAIVCSALVASCCLLLGQIILSRNISGRQRAEEGLEASEKRFEILCEQAPVGIYETDPQGLCVYTNSRWSEMSGLSATDSLGHGWAKVLHPEDRETVFKGWEIAARQGASWEYRLITPRGEIRWIRALGGPIYSHRGELTGYVGTLEDVTGRKQVERALQDREALNRAVLNSLPANIAVLKADGTIQATNDAWQRFAQANGDPPAGLVDTGADYPRVCQRAADAGSEDAAKALRGIQDVLAGKLQSFEMQYPCHSASERRWFHMLATRLAGVQAGGAVIAHVNITQRKRAEERFRLVVEASPSAMVVVDRDGKIILVNSRTEKLFGFGRRELLGQSIELLVPESSRERHEAFRKEFFVQPRARFMGVGQELYARRKDGTHFPVEIGLNPIETEENTWVLSSIVDITERQRADRVLRESRQELRALAGRLINVQEEERRRISRQLHDDLSQKLALLAFDTGSLILAPPVPPGHMKELLLSLQARVVQLSQDVRQIAHQLHPSILEDLGLTAALRELCEEFSAREGVEAVFEQENMPEALPVEVSSCLYGVAQEALHNVSKHARASKVRLMVNGSPEGVCLSIQDEGVGFDLEARASRHGLGIISMKERVRLVNGEFSVRSDPGHGTTVTVFAPVPKEEQ